MSSEHLIGRLCTKLAGRESGRTAIIVEVLEGSFVVIDGQVKRRRCNLQHLELFPQQFEIYKDASSAEISQLLEKEGISVKQPKEKHPGPKPIRKRSLNTTPSETQQEPKKGFPSTPAKKSASSAKSKSISSPK